MVHLRHNKVSWTRHLRITKINKQTKSAKYKAKKNNKKKYSNKKKDSKKAPETSTTIMAFLAQAATKTNTAK